MSSRLVVLALGLLIGCSSPPPPAAYHYTIVFHANTFADHALDGAILVVDGVEAGPLVGDFTRFIERETPGAIATVPAGHTLFAKSAKLALRFPTPCGTEDIPLTYKSEIDSIGTELRERARATPGHPYIVVLERAAEISLPTATAIWVDDTDAPAAKVTFGKEAIDGGFDKHARLSFRQGDHTVDRGRRRVLWDVGCAAEQEVTVDGKKVGVARATDTNARAFLISTEPGICHRQAELQYTAIKGPSYNDQIGDHFWHLGAIQVQPIGWQTIDDFLHPSDSVVAGDRSTERYALEREPCPPAQPGKPKPHVR